MNIRVFHISLIIVPIAMGAAYFLWPTPLVHDAPDTTGLPVQTTAPKDARALAEMPSPVPPAPPIEPVIVKPTPVIAAKVTPIAQHLPKAVSAQDAARRRYWEVQAQRFSQLQDRLSWETDPARRKGLIRAIAGYVRVDTLSTLDWAMNLTDPAEQRTALEAINKNALVGIGARIEVDETGFPKIRETMPLSAVESTGQVEDGDYIVGMVGVNGQHTSFDGVPIRQIVRFLRGAPGTEIRLLLEREPSDGGSEPYAFDVPVQRSLIVVQPPF